MMEKAIGTVSSVGASVVLALLVVYLVGYSDLAGGLNVVSLTISTLLLAKAGTLVMCGALLYERWLVAVGRTWVIIGAFLLGAAARSPSLEAHILGVSGLFTFFVGYMVLQRKKGVGHSDLAVSDEMREKTLRRMLEDCSLAR